jgi:VanZ family protein
MQKLLKSPLVWCIAVIAVIVVLVISSSQGSETSNSYSLRIAGAIYERFSRLFKNSGAVSEYDAILGINFIIRKAAHFSIFALLTVLLVCGINRVRINRVLRYALILLAVTVIAGADEFHQLFSGRGASITDVIIDICGALVVFGVIGIIAYFRQSAKGN